MTGTSSVGFGRLSIAKDEREWVTLCVGAGGDVGSWLVDVRRGGRGGGPIVSGRGG